MKIYTDGACSHNDTWRGGWAVVLDYGTKQQTISGYQLKTTNNQMELMACLRAFQSCIEPTYIELHTDSMYVIQILKGNFKANVNKDLIERTKHYAKKHTIRYKHVKGHKGNKLNELANELAQKQALTWK